nr:SpoIIE family protein phosphatase [uncultured Actinotalea sp.]
MPDRAPTGAEGNPPAAPPVDPAGASALVGLLGAPAARASGIGTFAWELASGRIAMDRTFTGLLGLRPDEVEARALRASPPHADGVVVLAVDDLAHRLHPQDRERLTRALLRSPADEDEVTLEFRAFDPTDEPRWLLSRAHLRRDDAGRVLGAVGSVLDTTSLAQGEARSTRLLETMPTALFLLDPRWRFTYVNAEAELLLGRSRAEALGRDMWELYPDAVGSIWEERYRDAVRTREPVVFDVHQPGPPERWLEVRAWPGPDGLAVYLLDATTARRATRALEHAARRGSLLAEITTALAGSPDPESAVRALADRVVPELADWAIVTLVDEETGARAATLRDVATRHVDPTRQQLAERYAEVRLDQIASGSYIEQAMTSGSVVHLTEDTTAKVRAVLRPGEARDIIDALAPRSGTLLPLRARGRTLGLLTLYSHDARPPLGADELRMVEEIAARAGLALDNARLRGRQVRLAERLQRSLLTEPVRADDLQVAVRYVPSAEAAQVGGDWYDAFRDADGSTLVVIGDVVGHDNEAVAAMGQLRSLLRGIAVSTGAEGAASSPATLLRGLERAVDLLETGAMASLVVARLEPADGGAHALHWSNAGHPPPLLVQPDGAVRALTAQRRDLFVGVAVDAARTDSVVTVAPGTTVLLYTDGLVERRDRPARDGIEELQDALRALAHLELEELCDAVLARMVPDGAQDDVALLAVQVRPTAPVTPAPAGPPTQRALGAAVPAEPGVRGEVFPLGPDTPLADARVWAAERAEALGAGPEELVLITLLTSEVVSNATRHGEGVGRLEVTSVDAGVRISVSDDGEGLPQVLHPDAGTPGGRGVWLVSELARAWGVDRLPGGGKAVWFEVGGGADGVGVERGGDTGVGDTRVGDTAGDDISGDTSGDDVAVLVLDGQVDADRRDELLAAVDAVLATGRPVVVRCAGLEFIDSTGLAALSRLAATSPTRPRVVAAPEHLRRILRLTGLDALLDLT